ncbi:MAG: TPM domain-containing protein [Tissierellaceae bacterium]|nr:TPM domain-containing protein [Tissierellaceae bacterium]
MVDTRFRRIILYLVLFILILIPAGDVFAEKILVIDNANLMTEDEILDLNLRANALSEEFNMDIVMVTTNDTEGKTSREFADDFFDYNGYGVGPNYDGILFLIDMDNREAYISTTGIAIRYLTDVRIESILDVVFDNGMGQGNYYGAALGFLEGTEHYLQSGIPSDQYNEPEDVPVENKLTLTDIFIAIIGGLGVGVVFVLSTKSQYKFRKMGNPYSYRSNSIVHFQGNEDRLINSFVTHRIIPKTTNTPKSTTGRSTTHRSSSGRSHGGGGRKF